MRTFLGKISAILMLFALWVLLSSPVSREELIAGALVSLLLILTPASSPELLKELVLTPKRIIYILGFLAVFVIEVIKSNIDVALRVVKPVIPIKPGIVQVNTKLSSKPARLLLANAITLTPGTITVDIHKDQLFIHWIYIDAEDVDTATKKIVSKFERYLEVIFG
jgi:multicomponent Na+:H+ antiporter subunit E